MIICERGSIFCDPGPDDVGLRDGDGKPCDQCVYDLAVLLIHHYSQYNIITTS